MPEIKYEIVKHLGVIGTSSSGWRTELNVIAWNDNPPKYDIRAWAPDHNKMGKGVTLTGEELTTLYNLIGGTNG